MAEISRLPYLRHLRSEPSHHVIRYRGGRSVASGRGLTFWFVPFSTSVVEIPSADREVPFLFHGRTADFQDVTIQGAVTYRVTDPVTLADRVDFSIDLDTGLHLETPLERIAQIVTQLAQQLATGYITTTPVRDVLATGVRRVREILRESLTDDAALAAMGLAVVTVRVLAVSPTADLEKALQTPTREGIQQAADEATFERRALAVEKERAIRENELQSEIELARREEQLIAQQGGNDRRRATEEAGARKIAAEAAAERTRLQSKTEAGGIRLVEEARVTAERDRMEIYRDLPPRVLAGLAAREFAGKLRRIDRLQITPESIGSALSQLMVAATDKLEEAGTPDRN